jgi:RsiW-degrading membrane proteinase PrsW (M82 family)
MDGAIERADGMPATELTTPGAGLTLRLIVRAGCWLGAGMLGVVATLLVVNAGVATILAALVLPVLTVMYVHRARVGAGEPVAVLALSVLTGAIAGAAVAALSRLSFGQLHLAQIVAIAQGRTPLSVVLLLGVTVPLIAELLKLAGPLLVRRLPRVRDEVMTGAVFGFASGIGYAAASTLVNYWPVIRDGYSPTGMTGIVDWSATLFGLTLLKPMIHGTTSALLGAGIWAATLRRGSVTVPVLAGLSGSVVYALGELLLSSRGTFAVLVLHGLLLTTLLILTRRTVHA